MRPVTTSYLQKSPLGYDNSYGYSHQHFFGVITPEPIDGYGKRVSGFSGG